MSASSSTNGPPTGASPSLRRGDDSSDAAAAIDVLLAQRYNEASAAVWNVPSLRPNQTKALCHIGNPYRPRTLLLVERTGGGKTHVFKVAGVVEKGLVYVMQNLHSLSADQLSKFQGANQAYGSVTAHNLDEVWGQSKRRYNEILHRAASIQRDTTSTLFLLSSPQFLLKHTELLRVLESQAKERVLRLVVVDEVHLHVQQGTTFRHEIRALKEAFFAKVYDGSNLRENPKVVFATGTMRGDYVGLTSALTTIRIPPSAIIWAGPTEFAQRNISMDFRCSADYTKRLDDVVTFGGADDVHFACVFIGSKNKSLKIRTELERKLDEALLHIDIVHVHGSLSSDEKYWFIRIFCEGIDEEDFRGRVLLATTAANVGIDNSLVTFVLNLGWTRDLCTYFQQRGRCGRDPSVDARCLQLGSVFAFVAIVFQIYNANAENLDDDPVEGVVGLNAAASPSKRAKTREGEKEGRYRLTSYQKKNNIRRALKEILEVVQFFVLDRGCWHKCAEWFLSCGRVEAPRSTYASNDCGTKCAMCTGEWASIFLPVKKDRVVRFLESEYFGKRVPLLAEGANIIDVLWSGEKWRVADIFGKKQSPDSMSTGFSFNLLLRRF